MSGLRTLIPILCLLLVSGAYAACEDGAECEPRTGDKCTKATQRDDCVVLSCLEKKCTPCRSDAECHSSSLVCNGIGSATRAGALWLTNDGGVGATANLTTTGGRCEHKALFPMDKYDWITLVLVILACILAASGGIGGGGLLVPLYILVSGFAANSASPLSSATITGGGIANYYSYSRRYHPGLSEGVYKPLIDYDTALLFMPALLLGTLYGTLLNKVLPEWLFLGLMFVLMCKYSIRTTNKGRRLYKKETEERRRAQQVVAEGTAAKRDDRTLSLATQCAAADTDAQANSSTQEREGRETNSDQDVSNAVVKAQDVGAALECADDANSSGDAASQAQGHNQKQEDDARAKVALFPRKQLLITVGAWILTFLIALFKGKAGSKSAIGVQCNSWSYWTVIVVGSVLLVALTAIIRKIVLDGIARDGASGDIKWDPSNTIRYPLVCVVCGVMAGLMGIGGGMVIGPLLIELGVVPQVVAATSAYTVIITASSATVQFMVMGSLQYDYGAFFAVVGLITTFVGQFVVDRMIKKYNRASVIVFAIAAIMVIATILLGYTGIAKVIRQVDNGSSLGMRPLCT